MSIIFVGCYILGIVWNEWHLHGDQFHSWQRFLERRIEMWCTPHKTHEDATDVIQMGWWFPQSESRCFERCPIKFPHGSMVRPLFGGAIGIWWNMLTYTMTFLTSLLCWGQKRCEPHQDSYFATHPNFLALPLGFLWMMKPPWVMGDRVTCSDPCWAIFIARKTSTRTGHDSMGDPQQLDVCF